MKEEYQPTTDSASSNPPAGSSSAFNDAVMSLVSGRHIINLDEVTIRVNEKNYTLGSSEAANLIQKFLEEHGWKWW